MSLNDFILNMTDPSEKLLLEGGLTALTTGVIISLAILFIVLYLFHALAWQTIAKKQKYKYPWFAWIPFVNIVQILQLGKFHWAWVFLLLIPIAGWIAIAILLTIAMWRIFEKEKQPAWFSLSYVLSVVHGVFAILYLIAIGIVAWQKPKKQPAKKKASKKKK